MFVCPSMGQEAPPSQKPAESLYLQLRSAGLDQSRVFHVRDAFLDRGPLHIALEDGTIAFTEDVAGRVSGAFFEGEGEVLLMPPNRVERGAMAFFTGAAILEERLASGYLRFNDQTFQELQPFLRPTDDAPAFASRWNETARNLATTDALRLLISYSKLLPQADLAKSDLEPLASTDRFLHARIQGRKLGAFDLYFDSEAEEQIWAGKSSTAQGVNYYDVWTSFTIAPATKDPVARAFTRENDDINIAQYRIQAEIQLPTALNADAWLRMEARRGGERAVLFELSRFLNIKSVEADGVAVEFIHNQAIEGTQLARRGNDLVAVVFPQVLRSGQGVELHFTYGGEVLSEAGGGLLYVGARGTWFPNRRLAMSNFDLQFRYPAGWTLLATGKKLAEPPLGQEHATGAATEPGQPQVSRWVSERPIPVAGFNLGKYTRAEARAGNVIVESYATRGVEDTFPRATVQVQIPETLLPPGLGPKRPALLAAPVPPPSPARNAQMVADTSARAIDFFAQRFGPFPYSRLALTQEPGVLSQGWPGLIFLSSFSFLNEGEKSRLPVDRVTRMMSGGVIAHETAHQWWGDLVTWGSYRDQWVVEALADYSSLMLMEATDPRRFRAVLDKYREDLLRENEAGQQLMEAGPVTLGMRLASSQFPAAYEAISYGRGVWLFHMLRHMMRDAEAARTRSSAKSSPAWDEPFIRALRRVRERFQGKAITTRDLLRVFQEELPASLRHEGNSSLDWFYEGWVNGTALPRFVLEGVKYQAKAGSTVVTGAIAQKDAPPDLVTPVPVYAILGGKSVLLGRVFVDEAKTAFQLVAPAGTRKVVLDPNQTLLTRRP